MPLLDLVILLAIGLGAGVLGGLLGIGGSIIMIPALTIIFDLNMHLAQAAALIVTFFVAVPATLQHHRARAVRWAIVGRMLPFGIAFIVLGVFASNLFSGAAEEWLRKIFACFLLYVVAQNAIKLVARSQNEAEGIERTEWWRLGVVGALVGFMAGLLGVGGGIVTVPLLQRLCRVPLRQSIAVSSAIMCLTAVFGAISKNATLFVHAADIEPKFLEVGADQIVLESMLIAACLASTAFLGGMVGASLTHRLPLFWVRLAFAILLLVTAIEMLF
jgi:uncharacterized membrane protein YfcA